MGFWNVKLFGTAVAGLITAFCTAGILRWGVLVYKCNESKSWQTFSDWVFNVYNIALGGGWFINRRKNEDNSELIAPLSFAFALLTSIGLIASLMFICGLRRNRLRLVAPLVYLTVAGIVFTAITALCSYTANLMIAPTVVHAALEFLIHCVIIGVEIIVFSPLYLVYRQMRIPNLHHDHYLLRTNEPVLKSTSVYRGSI